MIRKRNIGKNRVPPKKARASVRNSWTSPAAIERQRKRARALDLRARFSTFAEIGKDLGVSESTAQAYVVEAMAAITSEKAAQVLAMELERLNQLQKSIYAGATAGDIASIDCVLRISHRRAQLLGLYPNEKREMRASLTAGGYDADGKVSIEVSFVAPAKDQEESRE